MGLLEKEVDPTSEDNVQETLDGLGNVSFSGGSNRCIQIRGLGERDQYQVVPNHSVSIFLDHIDFSGVGGVIRGPDLRSVTVLRGPLWRMPQNTLVDWGLTTPSQIAGSGKPLW